jgi:hypothetical protein
MNPGGGNSLSLLPLLSTSADAGAGAAEEGEGEEGGAPMGAAAAGSADVAGGAVDPCCCRRHWRHPGRIARPQYCREVALDFCWQSGGEYLAD